MPEDLTQLTILLAGPHGTPYSQGLWRLKLSLPEDYPKSPPKAAFRTRIWHPNVEENTGSVCVDTLKKDWEPHLTLRHVLLVISCLLINPNPDSALNSTAGHLLQEDYDAFARQARLMTSIHARIPTELGGAVLAAKGRGETTGTSVEKTLDDRPKISRKGTSTPSVVMKNPSRLSHPKLDAPNRSASAPVIETTMKTYGIELDMNAECEDVEEVPDTKENDPLQCPLSTPPMTRKSEPKKRPLADLPIPTEDEIWDGVLSPSEKNIAANEHTDIASSTFALSKSKICHTLVERSHSPNLCPVDRWAKDHPTKRVCFEDFKENIGTANAATFCGRPTATLMSTKLPAVTHSIGLDTGSVNKTYKAKVSKARVGLRRL